MNRLSVFPLLWLLLFTSLGQNIFAQTPLPPARQEPGMQAQFESIYHTWRNAMIKKDLATWQKTVARYRSMETRNRIISEKQPFPKALFDSDISPPSLQNLVFLNVLTRRDTASAIYFGKADFGVSNPSQIKDNLLVLRFLKEQGEWRFDNTRIVRTGRDANILHNIRMQDFKFLQGPEFQPLGEIPFIGQPVPPPEMMAEVWVSSIGYETEIWINGYRTGKIKNNQGRELVMGGVRRGNNQILLRTTKTPVDKAISRLEVAVYAAKGPGEKAQRVFHFGPQENITVGDIQSGFSGVKLR